MRLVFRSFLAQPAEKVYAWHLWPGAFQQLVPSWEWVRSDEPGPLGEGVERLLQVSPLRVPWLARHQDFIPGRQFCDVQVRGPFRRWSHLHRFVPDRGGSWLEDRLDFELPLWPLSWPFWPLIRRQLESMFLFRHQSTQRGLELFRPTARPLRVGVTGASGSIGRALLPQLQLVGHAPRAWPRTGTSGCLWRPDDSEAVVHLAGYPVWKGALGQRHRRLIYQSRVEATRCLAEELAGRTVPPKIFLCASGIGYYGTDRRNCPEGTGPGDDFLARTCVDWETACEPLLRVGCRCVFLRLGLVLSAQSGFLPWLHRLYAAGPAWVPGDPGAVCNWVSLADALGAILWALEHPLEGPLNVVSPRPCSMRDMVDQLVATTPGGWRPRLPLSPRLLAPLGHRAELLPGGARVLPEGLSTSGYPFLWPELGGFLRHSYGYCREWDTPPGWAIEKNGGEAG